MATPAVSIPEGWSLDTPAAAPAAPADSGAATGAAIPEGWSLETPSTPATGSPAGGVAKAFGSGVAEGTIGLAETPGAITSLTQKPFDLLGNKTAEFADWLHPGLGQYVPSQANIEKYYADHPEIPPPPGVRSRAGALQEAGAVATKPLAPAASYQPTTTAEQWAKTAGTFTPGMLLGPEGFFEGGALGTAGRIGSRVALPTAGAEVGGKVAGDLGFDPQKGRAIGAIGAGMLPSVFENTVAGAVAPQVAPDITAAGAGAGVQLPTFIASESPFVQRMGKIMQSLPLVGQPLAAAGERAFQQMRGAVGRTAAEMGATTPAEAGQAVKTGMTNFLAGESDKANDLFTGVNSLIPDAQRTTLDNTLNTIGDLATRRAQAGITEDSPAINFVMNAATNPKGLSYNGIKDLRTYVGQKLDAPASLLPSDWNPAELKQIYGALTDDLRTSASTAGPDALAAWEKANQFQKSLAGRREFVASIIGDQAQNAPEAIYANMQRLASTGASADIAALQQAKETLGKAEWNQLAGTMASRMGINPATNEFSTQRFLTSYNQLSPAGKDALFGVAGTAGYRQAFDQVSTLAKKASMLDKFANPSGTGQTLAGGAFMSDLIMNPERALKSLGLLVPSMVLARPATASSWARWTRAYQAQSLAQRAGNASLTGARNLWSATRNLANTAGAAGIPIDAGRLGNAIGLPASITGQGDQGQQQ